MGTLKVHKTRKAWMAERNKGIGASEIATIVGMNPYATPLQIWAVKCGLAEPDDLSDNEAVEWGTRLEDIIAKKFAQETRQTIKNLGKYAMYSHGDHPEFKCTPDRIIPAVMGNEDVEGSVTALLEIKTAGAHMAIKWEDGPPQHYTMQVQWQLYVTGFQCAYIACLIGGQKFVWRDIQRNEEQIEFLVEKATEFWQMVQDRIQPPAEAGDKQVLLKLFPQESDAHDPDNWIKLDGDMMNLDDELEDVKHAIKELQETKEKCENLLKQAIGKAPGGVLSNGVVYSFKSQTRKQVTIPEKTFRVLRRKAAKE